MDHYIDRWRLPSHPVKPHPFPDYGQPHFSPQTVPARYFPTPAEVEEFRKLLERAREYDRRNNEPDCEMDEKRQQLKKLADELGIKIDFV